MKELVTGTWADAEIMKLVRLRGEGMTAPEISVKMNRKVLSVRNKLKDLKIKMPPNVDEEFFSRDDEYSHYVLGYWLADGCIMKKSGGHYFSIVSNDIGHLNKITNIMKIRNKLYKNSNDAYEIRVGSKKLVKNLKSIGGTYRKTETVKLSHIKFNGQHFRHLLRGYFDGDGSFGYSGYEKEDGTRSLSDIKFSGSKNIIKSLEPYMEDMGIEVTIYPDYRHSGYYMGVYGDNMRNLLDFMYRDSKLYLDRKKSQYIKGFR